MLFRSVLAHLYDLHFSSDTAPLVRLQALWEQSEPLGVRPRGVRLVLVAARADWRRADEIERGLRRELDGLGDPTDSGVLLYHLGLTSLFRGNVRLAFADGVVAAERLADAGQPYLATLAGSLVWLAGYHLGFLPMIERISVELAALADATGDSRAAAWLPGARLTRAWLAGEPERALVESESWAHEARARGDAGLALALRYRGELLLELGAVEAAAEAFEDCDRIASRFHLTFDWVAARAIGATIADARLRLLRSRGVRTRINLAPLLRSPRWSPRVFVAQAWTARALLRGEENARRLFDQAEAEAVRLEQAQIGRAHV